jgi:hypothetical protein
VFKISVLGFLFGAAAGTFCRSPLLRGMGITYAVFFVFGVLALMPVLHLLIPDSALLEAVTEQVKQVSEHVVEGALPDQPPTMPVVVVLDEGACDAVVIQKLSVLKNDVCVVLLLGERPVALDELLITEVFVKPFRLGYLLSRMSFYTDVAPRLRSSTIAIGPYRLEAQHRSLVGGGEAIRLTEKETALLEYLAQSSAPVGREELLASVWGYDARIDTHTLETHIYQLRRKIGYELIVNDAGLYRLMK